MTNRKYYANSFGWGATAKILDAGIKFITIPLLLKYFGEEEYGLLALAIATNAYMLLLNMGMNTGAIKFFSQWLVSGKTELLDRVARTNISFYLSIGVINSIILLLIAFYGYNIFNITAEQFQSFQYLLFILSGISIVSWTIMVFNQLLIADEKIAFTQQVLLAKALLNLALVVFTISFEFSLIQYFLCLSILNTSVLLPYMYLTYKRRLVKSLKPAFYWSDFYQILKYSLAIFVMSVFQYTATQSRPIILGIFSTEGSSILSQYRIIEVFPIFIISIGGMLISILLPKSSKAVQEGNNNEIGKIAYRGTTYSSILVTMLCVPIILNAENILTLYVGKEYSYLAPWLSLWCCTVMMFLHNSPVASLLLSTGKTKGLVFSSGIACVLSIVINGVLCNRFGVGSAVIGYFVYIIIQICYYYFYFNRRVLQLDSLRIFKAFIIPTLIGSVIMLIIKTVSFSFNNLYMDVIVKSVLWLAVFFILLLKSRILEVAEIRKMFIR
jgi:O-antigen/teichoic acid export membrane protein